jgi:phage shock protein PspC (stress-responsive transcriptional regulator)|tara:strand:- start:221 stop:436 length:216 start_codon:yes stop_codon:yes gene_type:complete
VKKLNLSQEDKKLAGLCGGMGVLFNMDSTLVRLLMVFGAIISGFFPLVLTYLVAWIIVPVAVDESDSEEDI